ncbi:MAG: cation:proton antiporter, partial [Muribaculaceae bacterium]|nr:cation:proton antiporter [Muribaculaceae bacterium]
MSISTDLLTLPLTQPVMIITLVLILILCAPLLFSRLKIPNIVGLILAGVAVGPYGFNLLARDASFEIFGQVGILYLMFLAAVEIDMYHLRRNYRRGIIFGLITFALPMAVGIPVTRYLLDISWTSSVLIASMYASHTLISYPVVSRFGLSNNRGAVIAVCGTIVAVLLALLALAEVVAVRVSGRFEVSGLIWMLVLVGVYALAVGRSFPLLTRWFFRKTSDSVMQFIFILTLVLVASCFAKLIGIEAILGAFYAGLILNPYIPTRSALMRRISFVGNAIFIPYFLIGVGMLI